MKITIQHQNAKAEFETDFFGPVHLELMIADLQKKIILEAIKIHGGNKTNAASALGMNRTTLCMRLTKYGPIRKGSGR